MSNASNKLVVRNFRVVAVGNDGSVSLLKLAENEFAARCIAQRAAARNVCSAVWVERWQGPALSGVWSPVCRVYAGSKALSNKPENSGRSTSPKSREVIECVLLPTKTRKNGWMAQVVDLAIAGPVTGHMPEGLALAAGQNVRLKICGIKPETGFVQLAWA